MNNLNLTILGINPKLRPYLLIDGKHVNYRQCGPDTYNIKYSTQKDHVEIHLFNYNEIMGRLWFLMSLLFFVISVFGIFDTRYKKNCLVTNLKFIAVLKEDVNMVINYRGMTENGKAAFVSSNCLSCKEIENECRTDKRAQKRLKIMLAVRLLAWAAIIATTILVLTILL